MAYDEAMVERIRDAMLDAGGVDERKMFGCYAFMVNGNMACGSLDDRLLVRVGPDAYEDALELPGASVFEGNGRVMRGFVEVDAETIASDAALTEWVERGVAFAATLPPK